MKCSTLGHHKGSPAFDNLSVNEKPNENNANVSLDPAFVPIKSALREFRYING